MRNIGYKKGFTLVELLIALSVSGIILTAVATLAFALSSAHDSTEDTSEKQAQLRYTTLKLSDMIRQCRLVCGNPGDDIVIWKADDNPDDPNNGKIDISELVYIEAGNDRDYIEILELSDSFNWINNWFINILPNPISYLQTSWFKEWVRSYCNESEVVLIPECSNVQFRFDESPPQSRFVSITFELTEDGTVRQYEIDCALRGWAGNLLNSTGTAIINDDD